MVAFSETMNLISCFKNLKHLFVLLEECKYVGHDFEDMVPLHLACLGFEQEGANFKVISTGEASMVVQLRT